MDGRSVAATERAPPSVTGDGKTSIQDLIAEKNAHRKNNPHLATRLINASEPLQARLAKLGLSIQTVLEDGRRLQLDGRANVSIGGDSIEVTTALHPSFHELAVRAVRAVPGLGYAGVDIMASDLRAPPTPANYVIGEVESNPGLTAQFPVVGIGRNIAREILRYDFGMRHQTSVWRDRLLRIRDRRLAVLLPVT